MPIRVKDGTDKWAAVAGVAGATWVAETVAAARKWKDAVSVADFGTRWQTAVAQASARARFTAGLSRMQSGVYAARVEAAGAARYQSGVQNAKERYRAGFAPYRTALQGAELSARGPKGEDNIKRVVEVVRIMMATKAAVAGSEAGTDLSVGQSRFVPQSY